MSKKGDHNPRDDYGVIATLEHRTTKQLRTVHQYGYVKQALAAVLELFDPAIWRVATISSPRTILKDLKGRQGARTMAKTSQLGVTFAHASVSSSEMSMLSQIGRQEFIR